MPISVDFGLWMTGFEPAREENGQHLRHCCLLPVPGPAVKFCLNCHQVKKRQQAVIHEIKMNAKTHRDEIISQLMLLSRARG